MNVFKRPMFYAAIICCIVAALSLFAKSLAFVISSITIITLVVLCLFKKYKFIFVAFALILLSLNLFAKQLKIDKINSYNSDLLYGKFVVTAEVVEYDEFNTVTLKSVSNDKICGNVKILLFDYDKTQVETGDIVEGKFRIKSIDKRDKYRLSNYSNGIYATASAQDLNVVDSNFLYKTLHSIRVYVNKTLSGNFDSDIAGLLCAITAGDKTLISEEMLHNIKTTGISHVVVVSGMHLAIIMSALFFVFDKIFYNKYFKCILSIIVILLITAVCGFSMSIIRAGVTFIIASFAPVFKRENDSLSSLLTAITLILVCDPFAIYNISFLLSVLSTLAILWVVPFFSNFIFIKLRIHSNIIKTLIQMFLCCVFANIFTLPVSIKIFGYVSIVSPITNLCITYFVTLTLILSVLAVVLSTLPIIRYLGELCLIIAGWCARLMSCIINAIADLPVTVMVLPKNAFWISILIIVGIVALMYYINNKSVKKEVIKCQ